MFYCIDKFNNRISASIKKTACVLISVGVFSSFVFNSSAQRFSDVYSRSAIVSDLETGRIVYAKNADKKTAMASLTKIMTLLLAFDSIKEGRVSEDDVVEIIQSDVNRYGTNMKLDAGDKVSLKNLMRSMMIISANDSALAIARHISGDYESFVKKMNQKAKEIGMNNTKFYNPNGLPENIGGQSFENHTTASDVLKLSKWIYENYPEKVTDITNTERFVYPEKNIDEENTNPLLKRIADVDGLKTGFTDAAGYCLSYSMKLDDKDGNQKENRLFGVSLGAGSKKDREEATYSTLMYIKEHYKTKEIFKSNQVVSKVEMNKIPFLSMNLYSKDGVLVIKKDGEKLNTRIRYNRVSLSKNISSPSARMEILDEKGNILSFTDLYPYKSVEDFDFLTKVKISLSALVEVFDSGDTRNDENLDKPVYSFF